MKKGILTMVLIAAVLLVGVIVFSVLSINPIIEKGVEYVGPKLTQAEVRLAESDISIFSGEGALHGLFVGNPAGFESESAIRVGTMRVVVDKDSFSSDKIVIPLIEVVAPKITYERKGKTSNIDTLLANVKKAAGAEEKARTDRQESGSSAEADAGPKLIIKDLYIRDAEVTLAVAGMKGSLATATVPVIHLRNIGAKSGGASPAEVLEEVLGSLTKGVGGVAAGLTEGLKKGMDSVKDGAEKLGDEIGSGIKKLFGE